MFCIRHGRGLVAKVLHRRWIYHHNVVDAAWNWSWLIEGGDRAGGKLTALAA